MAEQPPSRVEASKARRAARIEARKARRAARLRALIPWGSTLDETPATRRSERSRLLRTTRSGVHHVIAYIAASMIAVLMAAGSLALLDLRVGPSATLHSIVVTLAAGGASFAVALGFALIKFLRTAATVAIPTTWVIAASLVWYMPIITPVGLLVLHVPSLVLTDVFRLRTRSVVLAATIGLTGGLVLVGEWRRHAWNADHPDIPGVPLLVGVFTMLVAGILVAALRDYMVRMARHTLELQQSRARLADAALDARRALERDLHDGAQQRLATLAVDLGRIRRSIYSDPEKARELSVDLQEQLNEAIRELRVLAHGIYPPILEERGLPGALPAAARRTSLPCTVDVQLGTRHTKAVEAAVYFCCLEAMQNADKHCGGKRITVLVHDDDSDIDGGLRFSVADDGLGFDLDAKGTSHGLTGMRDRVQSAGGELSIASARGQGTTISGRFPLGTAVGN
ncbi:sensor histidine kinase [Phycicoccus sp. CSK15P-2]|uniref:sensor histidine kinase n=1 Tax=Phycicoccus sp. CSK15P-2 TaxID=2807627 RepID=UPI0019518F87|nr:sensor histidine kinase [Phycicoccus sp. CSK15P-2]MBM6404523.1 sensor histidine kinase [Phycicoccus sp. CSK15P-2]